MRRGALGRRRPRKDRGTELRYNILTRQNGRPAILQPQCVPFFLRHMRATVSPRISSLLLVETVKRTDEERSIADERIEDTGRRNEERDKAKDRTGFFGQANSMRLPTYC